MKCLTWVILMAVLATACEDVKPNNDGRFTGTTTREPNPYDVLGYVDTRVGTAATIADVTVSQYEEPWGYVSPIVGNPSALTHWTPQTALWTNRVMTVPVPYWYDQEKIQGFRATHYPNGAVVDEWGAFSLMPMIGRVKTVAPVRASQFRHETEVAKPHYYSVQLDDYNIKAEITGASKTGFFQFTFPSSNRSSIVFDGVYVPGTYKILPEKSEIEGEVTVLGKLKSYFVARFDKDFHDYSLVLNHAKVAGPELFNDGFTTDFFNNMTLEGQPVVITTFPSIDHTWPNKPHQGVNEDQFSARFSGTLTARRNGEHTFELTTDDGTRMYIDGERVIDSWFNRGAMTDKFSVDLTTDQQVKVVIEYFENGSSAKVQLKVAEPVEQNVEEIRHLARQGHRAESIYVTFPTTDNEVVKLKVATSLISHDQARKNMDSEYNHWDFEKAVKQGKAIWEGELNKISVEGTEVDKAIFYTALAKTLVSPRNLNESGKYFSPFDFQVHEGEMYTDLSLWDTFRSLHPLWVILKPQETTEVIKGLLNAYQEGGWIPKWPNPSYRSIMMGTHGDAVIADAYVKGIRSFDAELAFEAMLKNAYQKGDDRYTARVGIEAFNALGYVPSDQYEESVARTLEFSYGDYAIAQMAKALGKHDQHQTFIERSKRYRHVLDPETGLVRGKTAAGEWLPPLDKRISLWAQGDDRDTLVYYQNHTLLVPHDIAGLAMFMGGNAKLEQFLDDFFANNYYYVGDEFSMHAPYIYNAIGAPWKTQKIVREILAHYFFNDPGGLPGNDDCGQVSSWYVFGAMGFYPALPGDPTYQLTSPVLDKIQIDVGRGNVFTIIAHNNSKKNIYIQSASLNGLPYHSSRISHDAIMAGGTLVYEMGPKPNKHWGIE